MTCNLLQQSGKGGYEEAALKTFTADLYGIELVVNVMMNDTN